MEITEIDDLIDETPADDALQDGPDAGCASPDGISVKGRTWTVSRTDPDHVRTLVRAGIPHGVAPVLSARGMDVETAHRFMNPDADRDVPCEDELSGTADAADVLASAVRTGERVAIFGDYDVDGGTASAIGARVLGRHGGSPRIYVPDRFTEGYGPNVPAIEKLADEGCGTVLFVDCGTVAHDSLGRAAELGMRTVVVDHHVPGGGDAPATDAVINPNLHAGTAERFGHMCAAGLTWVLARAVDVRLGGGGVRDLLDLAALGTVADVVPLTGANRALVSEGLRVMDGLANTGVAALASEAGIKPPFRASHCGFGLGPRVNAGGRVGESLTGARLLSSDDRAECADLASRLDSWNAERQTIERSCKDDALQQVDDAGGGDLPVLFAAGEEWHEGVIGIVASRLKDAHDRPSFVFSRRDGRMVGSARSMPGFDMGACVHAAMDAGLLDKGGGHPMAAGMSTTPDRYEAFKAFVEDRVRRSEFWETGPVAEHDLEIVPDNMHPDLADPLEAMAPFGVGAPRPRVVVRDARLVRVQVLDDKKSGEPAHLKLHVATKRGGTVAAIAFHVAGTPLFEALRTREGHTVDLSGTLTVNEFRGKRSVELALDDALV